MNMIYLDIVRGTNYLLESLGIDHRIRSISEFVSPVLIPIYEKICSCKLNGSVTDLLILNNV